MIGNSNVGALPSEAGINSPQSPPPTSDRGVPGQGIPAHPPTDKHWIHNINQEEVSQLQAVQAIIQLITSVKEVKLKS